MKTLILSLFLFFGTFLSFCQKNFNLPPGESLPQNFVLTDYSYKLTELQDSINIDVFNEPNFLYFLSENDLEYLKKGDLNKFKYYMEAQNYFQNLSKRLKVVYTIDELWYIYKFDSDLSNTLMLVW